MFLDADSTFYERWGGAGTGDERKPRAAAKMVSIVHAANNVLNDMNNFGTTFGINIAGTEIHTDHGWLNQSLRAGVSPYEAYLGSTTQHSLAKAARHSRAIPADEVCLNFLFVHKDSTSVHIFCKKGDALL